MAPRMVAMANMAIAVSGIYTCYLAYGVFQEGLYSTQPDGSKFAATAFVLAVQCVVNAAVAAAGMLLQESVFAPAGKLEGSVRKPVAAGAAAAGGGTLTVMMKSEVIMTAAVYVLAMYTSNEALGYVSFPTQALVKSCKMIPVMLGSILIAHRRYGWLKWLCVLLMTVGIALFQFGAPAKKSRGGSHAAAELAAAGQEWIGMMLLVASLTLDGIAGPLQERLKLAVPTLTTMQHMLVNNVWATILMLAIAISLGEVSTSVRWRCCIAGATTVVAAPSPPSQPRS
mgnify:CR=1 FL=1